MRSSGWALANIISVLIRAGDLDRDTHYRRKTTRRHQGEGDHLKTKEKGFGRNTLDLELPVCRIVKQ